MLKTSCLVLLMIYFLTCHHAECKKTNKTEKDKEELSAAGFCAGCQATVKELSKSLKFHTNEPIKKRVPKLLNSICKKDNFKHYEFTPSVVEAACKQMMKNNKTDIENTLVDYYTAKNRKDHSYLDIVQTICHNVVAACHGGQAKSEDIPKQGGIVYNRETDNFDVIPGANVKMVRPTQQSHDEL